MINFDRTVWNRDPTTVPAAVGGRRTIAKGPLINLAALQARIGSGNLDVNNVRHFWIATRKCESDLQKYQWTYAQVGKMLSLLRAGRRPGGDYKKSEWCEVSGGKMYPCDVYELHFDEVRGQRNRNALPVYLKFSLDEAGQLMLVLVSCHLS